MSKTAFVFPGQGSQYVGMGRELAQNYAPAAEVFAQAAAVLGQEFVDIINNGPEDALKQTAVTQPAILTASIASLRVLESKGVKPEFVAGHSLGEYSAHVAAGTFSFQDAVKLVRERGQLMQEASPPDGAMAAILGLDSEQVRAACVKASCHGIVEVANYNCPGQVVISGQLGAVKKAIDLCKEAGAKRGILLQVSGPFHSSLMIQAGERLGEALLSVKINDPELPLIANINAEYVKTRERVTTSLIQQVSSSVRWEECIRRLAADGTTVFVEVGPGKVLAGLIKKIIPNVKVFGVEDVASLEKFLAYLEESR
ncbi:MAG TPA: ACP S-malonyltransferase [Desulfobacteria bacterium]|nr:ACP S-malonyltransferase [Desulfobacteria bacterium]